MKNEFGDWLQQPTGDRPKVNTARDHEIHSICNEWLDDERTAA